MGSSQSGAGTDKSLVGFSWCYVSSAHPLPSDTKGCVETQNLTERGQDHWFLSELYWMGLIVKYGTSPLPGGGALEDF